MPPLPIFEEWRAEAPRRALEWGIQNAISVTKERRRQLIDFGHAKIPISRQCELLGFPDPAFIETSANRNSSRFSEVSIKEFI
jgi:hypothetical protein